jgi:hypothetical protein
MRKLKDPPHSLLDPTQHINIQFRLVGGISFLKLGDRKAVFSEKLQKVFELNDTSAYLASCLVDNPTLSQLLPYLEKRGLTKSRAMEIIRQFVTSWSRAKILSAFVTTHHLLPCRKDTISIAGHCAALHFFDEVLAEKVSPVFSHLKTGSRHKADIFNIVSHDGLAYIFQTGKTAQIVELDQTVPALKGMLTDWLLAGDGFTMALHCAMLVLEDKALLVTGPPGAGKTTLTMALLARGFAYAADDITLLLPDGRVQGVSFAPALKPGAWKLSKQFAVQLSDIPIHKRVDGKRVRYVSSMKLASQAPFQVNWIAALDRNTSGPTRWQTTDATTMLKAIIGGAHAHGERLNDGQLRVLINVITKAIPGVFHYADAHEAARYLENNVRTNKFQAMNSRAEVSL